MKLSLDQQRCSGHNLTTSGAGCIEVLFSQELELRDNSSGAASRIERRVSWSGWRTLGVSHVAELPKGCTPAVCM